MRKLRVVFTTMGGAVPALLAAVLVPTVDACGSDSGTTADGSTPVEAGDDSSKDASDEGPQFPGDADAAPDSPEPVCNGGFSTVLVELPPVGVVADPGQLCAVAQQPVSSNTSARVTLTNFSQSLQTAFGFIALAPGIAASIVGLPTITVPTSSNPAFATMQVAGLVPIQGGYIFKASWTGKLPNGYGGQMTVKVSYTISCADGGTQTVDSITKIDLCIDGNTVDWVSSGDACTVCPNLPMRRKPFSIETRVYPDPECVDIGPTLRAAEMMAKPANA